MAFDTLNIGRSAPVLVAGGDMPDSVLKQLAAVYAAVNLLSASPTITLSADNYQLTVDHTTILKIDGAAADRDVRLFQPLSNTQSHWFLIINGADADEELHVKTYDEGATVSTIAQNRAVIFCLAAGSWSKLCTFTIAL